VHQAAALTDVGTERPHNEDACGVIVLDDHPASGIVAVVCDGVSSGEAGETASGKAVEVTLRAFREHPAAWSFGKRLFRAVQQANIEVYDLALVVPELRGMSTTLTAVAVAGGELSAAHIGDSRLYLARGGSITQLTKDHTVAAEKTRLGLLRADKARNHPDRSTLTRSLGRELIAAIDRITTRVQQGDTLIVCSDGLYNVLEDQELREIAQGGDPADACRGLIEAANQRGTVDNLSAVVIRVDGGAPDAPRAAGGLRARLAKLVPWRT